MAHTFRCRHSIPHGWVMRDDGDVYSEEFPDKRSHKQAWRENYEYMRAYKSYKPRKFRCSLMRKEAKSYRKAHYKQYAARIKNQMRHEDWENLHRFRRTGGWLSW